MVSTWRERESRRSQRLRMEHLLRYPPLKCQEVTEPTSALSSPRSRELIKKLKKIVVDDEYIDVLAQGFFAARSF